MTKVFIIFLLSISIPLAIAAAITGFYPVASVGTDPVFYRTWAKSEEAAKKFANASLRSSGSQPVDFNASKSANLLLEIRRNALTFLIEDKILEQEGKSLTDAFDALSRERVVEARRGTSSEQMAQAAKLVYGLSAGDFENLVLLPQARRDVAVEILLESRAAFEDWFLEIKKKKQVRLFFVPFTWDGEAVR